MQPPSSGRYRFGDFLLDVDGHTLERGGEPVALAPKAFDLLTVLAKSSGRLLTKGELLNLVWPNALVEENNLTVTISALRKALGATPDGRQYVENVPRVGYRLSVPAARLESGAATLDPVDRKLVALLQENARTPVSTLAKAVDLSRSAVQERLARLESRGVIARYTVRLGPGRRLMHAWMWVRNADGFSCDDVLPLLETLPCVVRAESLAGEVDLAILVQVETAAELADARETVAAFKGVESVTTAPVLRVLLARD